MKQKFSELKEGVDYIDLGARESKEIWILPESAGDIIMETLAIDATSSFIEESIQNSIVDAYNEVKRVDYERVRELISTILAEVRPIEGHTDPGAIQDCWNELRDLLDMAPHGRYPSKKYHTIESFDM